MGTTLNGNPKFVRHPATANYGYVGGSQLMSCNNPVIFQVVVPIDSPLYVPSQSGDIVNVIFEVYAKTDKTRTTTFNAESLIATIRKGVDAPKIVADNQWLNKSTITGTYSGVNMVGKLFTIDISSLVKTKLSYSLIPVNKGTLGLKSPNAHIFGALNGQYGGQVYGS